MTHLSTTIFLGLVLLFPSALFADDALYGLIHERLALMKQVAAHKWINGIPIEAPERETFVIQQAVNDGLQFGITTDASRAFFGSQIAAAKDIQQCWFDRWSNGSGPVSADDLVNVVRPKLITLGTGITARLVGHRPDPEAFTQTVSIDCLSESARQQMQAALNGISTYPDRLSQIVDSGMLRIGTTGDYAPFSWAEDGAEFTGIDIDLGRDLAASLSAEAVFIKTSWPGLMEDLAAGRYDIAMSGVSINAARMQHAFFTSPYHIGGKSPITLCSRVQEFDSLSKINRAGVRAVVNPGGTNEQFLDAQLGQTVKVMHADNRTIFEEIINGRADLMVTDIIEVRLKAGQHPELCGAMPDKTLTYQEKGYMLPKDPALLAAVNRWLADTRSKGLLEQIFSTHLH